MKKSLLLAGMILAAQQNNAFAAAGDDIVDLTQDSEGLSARAASASPLGDDGEEVSSNPVSDEDYALLVAAGVEGEGDISGRAHRNALRHQLKVADLLGIRAPKRARENGVFGESAPKAGRVALGNSRLANSSCPYTDSDSDSEASDSSELSAAQALLILSVRSPLGVKRSSSSRGVSTFVPTLAFLE